MEAGRCIPVEIKIDSMFQSWEVGTRQREAINNEYRSVKLAQVYCASQNEQKHAQNNG